MNGARWSEDLSRRSWSRLPCSKEAQAWPPSVTLKQALRGMPWASWDPIGTRVDDHHREIAVNFGSSTKSTVRLSVPLASREVAKTSTQNPSI